MFKVSVNNAVQLDHALEQIINFFFYVILFFTIVVLFGFNPTSAFAGVFALATPLSFLFSSAASKWFEVRCSCIDIY